MQYGGCETDDNVMRGGTEVLCEAKILVSIFVVAAYVLDPGSALLAFLQLQINVVQESKVRGV